MGRRILFVAGALFLYWVGTGISIPGINSAAFAWDFRRYASGYLHVVNIILGGAVERLAILSLGILPYISASIVMLLVTASFPKVKALNSAGAQGRKQINQYTRYLGIALAAFQAQAIAFSLEKWPGLVIEPGWFFRIGTIVTLIAGTVFLIWLGDQITKRGFGNGIMLLFIAGPALGLLSAFAQVLVRNS